MALPGAVDYRGLNVRFTLARGLAAQIVSQNFSQYATPAIGSGRFFAAAYFLLTAGVNR